MSGARGAEEVGEDGNGVEGVLAAGGQEGGEDFQRMGAPRRAVAAAHFAVDHGGADGLFGGPVRDRQETKCIVTFVILQENKGFALSNGLPYLLTIP